MPCEKFIRRACGCLGAEWSLPAERRIIAHTDRGCYTFAILDMFPIILDIETKETFADVGSHEPSKLSVSMVCVYSYKEGKFFSFTEHELNKLWPHLDAADVLIGFNIRHFDLPVLARHYPGDILQLPIFDLLEVVKSALGFRLKLDTLAQATLGVGKSANGLDAVAWYKQGEIEKIRAYCLQDVAVTRDLFEHGRKHGKFSYLDFGVKREFPVRFDLSKFEGKAPANLSLPL